VLLSAARKRVQSPYSGPVAGELAAKVRRLVVHNVDFECLLESVPGWNKGVGTEVLRQHVRTTIEVKPKFQMFTEQEVLENLVIAQARKSVLTGNLDSLARVAGLAERLKEEGVMLEGAALDMEIVNKVEDAEVSWLLHKSGLATLDQQWDEKWPGDARRRFLDSLEHQCRIRSEAGLGVMAALISLLSDEKSTMARFLLERMLRRVLDRIYGGKELNNDASSYSWLSFPSLPYRQQKTWATFSLQTLVTHGVIKVGDAVTNQAVWREKGGSLVELASALAQAGLEARELVGEVSRLVVRQEVNWRGLLALITGSTALPGAEREWWGLISDLVKQGTEEGEGNSSSLLAGLLLARQAAGPGFQYPSYVFWFAATFAEETSTLAEQPQHLVDLLTSLLPFEPAAILRAHLTRPPWLPKHQLSLLDDYKALARARLQELGENATTVQPPSSQALEEALAAVKEWTETNRLPRLLIDCFMWQQDMWTGRLLPAILTCSPDTQLLVDGRDKLVEALHAKGKVPGHLYSRYRAGTLLDNESKGDSVEKNEENIENANLEKLNSILENVELLKDCELRNVLEKAKHLVRKLCDQELSEGSFSPHGIHREEQVEHLTSLSKGLQFNS